MNKLYATIAFFCFSVGAYTQCMVQASCNWATCYGACDGTATATVINGVPPYAFMWSPGGQTTQTITGQCAGIYTCTMTDSNGCTATAQCTIGSPGPLQVSIFNYQNPTCPTCCDGYAVGSASGGTGAYTYWWTPTNQTTPTAQSLCAGNHVVCVTDGMGCATCDTVALSFTAGVTSPVRSTQFSVTPVGDGIFSLAAQFQWTTSGEIVITNLVGQDIRREKFGTSQALQRRLDLSNEAPGVYFVSIVTDAGIQTVRVIRD